MGWPCRRAHCGHPGEVVLQLNSPLLYWHTLRYLRPGQLYRRLWFQIARPRPNLVPPPDRRSPSDHWIPPAQRESSLVDAGSFVFLSVHGDLDEIGWDGPEREKLWRYNQHYFDDLNARTSESRTHWHRELLVDWVLNNPPGSGNGWEPYPTSLRIVNWVKWALAGNVLPQPCLHSLAVQARWLMHRLEYHLSGNHLFANAKALVFAGLFFGGPETDGWLARGLSILEREVPEQILADGGHFERSTMYHALVLEDMLDLCNLIACYSASLSIEQRRLAESWSRRIPSMMTWLDTMCHPDGEIGFFNDAALGIAATPSELRAYAERLGVHSLSALGNTSLWLQSSGYARLATTDAVALLDLAPVGSDYLPGHAHADTLSFELSVHGQRVLVNSGTSSYGTSAERLRQRGTTAHNTVVVANKNSSEVWNSFRVARRARIVHADVQTATGVKTASGAHNGYTRLPGSPVHLRQWSMREDSLVVEDSVSDKSVQAVARFHFHPDISLSPAEDHCAGSVLLPDGRKLTWSATGAEAWIESTTWHPRFGQSLANVCLCVRLKDGSSLVRWQWS